MKSILSMLPIPAIVVDDKNNILLANSAAEQNFQIQNTDSLKMLPEAEQLIAQVKAAFSNKQPTAFEYAISETKTFNISSSLTEYKNKPAVLLTFIDISEYAAKLKNQHELMRCMAHELKAPIGAISGYLDLVIEGLAGSPEKEKEMLQKSRDRADGLLEFIGEVLLYAKTGQNMSCRTDENINISHILYSTCDLFQAEAENKKQKFIQNIQNDISIVANKLELSRIFTNLVSNAVKYTPENGTITVSLAEQNNKAVITVQDTGIGIPENEQSQLFTEFHRASNALESKIPGTGLGMAITKKLITKYGGKIDVQSQKNKGTTFTVTLDCKNEN